MIQSSSVSRPTLKYSLIAGWPHLALTRDEFARLLVSDCALFREAGRGLELPKLVFDLNGQGLSLAETDKNYRLAMDRSDYIHADGQSLVFASRLLSKVALPERIATTDFFHDAAKLAEELGLNFYLLGSTDDVVGRTVSEVQKLYPKLKIVGYRSGYFSEAEEPEICKQIVEAGTDVLWLGLGKPKEQVFSVRNLERLRGVVWIKTCGGLFDFLSGKNTRAPQWMQSAGLEWLYRLALEPKRLFWRYFVTNFHSIYILLKGRKRGA